MSQNLESFEQYNRDVEDENEDEVERDGEGQSDDEEQEEEDEDEEDEDDEDEDDEDDNVEVEIKGSKSKRRGGKLGSSKRKHGRFDKKSIISKVFDVEAQHGDSEEEEEIRPQQGEVIIEEDERQAIDAVQRRHEKNREFIRRDVNELAAEYQRRALEERRHRSNILDVPSLQGGKVDTVLQQSLLPSVSDPCIWRFKAATGKEQQLVLTIMRKAIDSKLKGGPLRVKSAFCGSSKGYIYVEGIAEPLVRDAVYGLRGIYVSSMKLVPVQEMTSLLNVVTRKVPIKPNQWARVSRGPLKGDLVKIVMLYEGGDKVMIQAVPRPDYSVGTTMTDNSNVNKKASVMAGLKARPPQRLFEVSEVTKAGGESTRKSHPDDRSSYYEFWNNEYYKDGFLYKTVNPDTFLHTSNVNPKVEEQKLFLTSKKKSDKERDLYDPEDNEADDEDEEEAALNKSQSLLTDLAENLASGATDEKGSKVKACPFVVGDLVQVAGGELRNLVARVIGINEIQQSCRVAPISRSALNGEFTIEINLLVKYVEPNQHIKVISGVHMGQTGRVVSVNLIEGRPVAAILTDGINTEIQVDVSNIQVSSEVTTGLGSLMGYELYDLVAINDNECAVVIFIGAEKLTVLNHMDVVKDCYPQELLGKRNSQSTRSTGFDKNQNTVSVGNVVSVVDGTHARKTGTIKHIMKGTLWLHSNSVLKHSGVFAVRARSCVVAGIKPTTATGSLSASMAPPSSIGTKIAPIAKPNSKVAKDSSIGLTVRIKKGQYKGLLAQITDVSGEQYTVELLAKLKKITIDKANTVPAGDKSGSLLSVHRSSRGDMDDLVPDSQYLMDVTPAHFSMNETPRHYGDATPSSTPYGSSSSYGEATPMGNATPSGGRDNIWAISDRDYLRYSQQSQNSGRISSVDSQGNWNTDSEYDPYGSASNAGSRNPYNSSSTVNNNSYPNNSGYGVNSGDGWSYSGDSISPASHNNFGSSSNVPSSSPVSSVSYSPYGVPPSPYGPTTSTGTSSKTAAVDDWVPDMLVTFKYGANAGKTGIIRRLPDERYRNVTVAIRDHSGQFSSLTSDVDPSEVAPIIAAKRMRVRVVAGKNKGRMGLVQTVTGSDYVVSLEGSSTMELIKSSDAVCIA